MIDIIDISKLLSGVIGKIITSLLLSSTAVYIGTANKIYT